MVEVKIKRKWYQVSVRTWLGSKALEHAFPSTYVLREKKKIKSKVTGSTGAGFFRVLDCLH